MGTVAWYSCASGLHSLAALRLGAAEVISFDYDPKPVEATSILYKYAGETKNWKTMPVSILDVQFMTALPKTDMYIPPSHRRRLAGNKECRDAA
jgi:predicted nicotinamide N-methyase